METNKSGEKITLLLYYLSLCMVKIDVDATSPVLLLAKLSPVKSTASEQSLQCISKTKDSFCTVGV